jgi:hypothetical protein
MPGAPGWPFSGLWTRRQLSWSSGFQNIFFGVLFKRKKTIRKQKNGFSTALDSLIRCHLNLPVGRRRLLAEICFYLAQATRLGGPRRAMASPPRTFAELGLSVTSQAGLDALGFELMTPVQGPTFSSQQIDRPLFQQRLD